ncbi:MAG: hypothetical protein ABW106_02020 [Steroidobacteraceae bacterium]
MIELAELAQEGVLREFFAELPQLLSPANGVTGIGLKYNDDFVADVVRHLYREFPAGSVEHSARVAAALATITREEGEFGLLSGKDPVSESFVYSPHEVLRRWRELSWRRFGRSMSPIEIEITLGPDFPRLPFKSGGDRLTSFRQFPIRLRRSKRSRLHFAESGGRLCETRLFPGRQVPRWGTLGGFLISSGPDECYAVTAAHVLSDDAASVNGTPAFQVGPGIGMNRALQDVTSRLSAVLPHRLKTESGNVVHRSPPDLIPRHRCTVDISPQTQGLDVALAQWPMERGSPRTLTTQVALGEISQVLTGSFFGARSGPVNVRVTNYSVWHAYDLDATGTRTACISNCIEVALERRPYVRADVSRPGDSGAWMLAQGSDGRRWVGMLIGGDGERSGIVPAHRILDSLMGELGTLIPSA